MITRNPQPMTGSGARYQFGIRSMLLGVLVLAAGLSVLASRLSALRRENAAIAQLEARGGLAVYRWELVDEQPGGPRWLRAIFGANFMPDGVYVDLSPCTGPIGVSDLRLLMDIRYLFAMRLGAISVDDDVLKVLCRLTSLEQLSAEHALLTDEALIHLCSLPNIRGLNLHGTDITDACIDAISSMHNLVYLEASGTRITPEGCSRLRDRLPGCSVYCAACN